MCTVNDMTGLFLRLCRDAERNGHGIKHRSRESATMSDSGFTRYLRSLNLLSLMAGVDLTEADLTGHMWRWAVAQPRV